MSGRLDWRMALLLSVPPLMWAGNAVVGRLMVGQIPPLALNALRWTLAGALLLPLAWRVLRHPEVIRIRWGYFAKLGLFGVGSYNALQYMGLHTSTPVNITLIAASSPVWMLMIGSIVYGVRARGVQLAGAALSLAGVALVLSRGEWARLAQIQLVPGDLLMLAAVISWGFYSWLLARPPESMRGDARPSWNWAEFLFVQVMFGWMWGAAAAGAEQVLAPADINWSGSVVAAIVFVAIGPSILAYYCWGKGVAAVGPATAAFFSNLTPVFATLLSAMLLGQSPGWYHLAAFALIAAGIVVTSRPVKTADAR
ncbi:DMT family transporter [Piscinibacter sakaiensis]|uniref:DMT family transporter n=1 Tax=Piscinibacter sakaiensis TaxID=1547922 RepID=UPI003AAEA197